MVSERRKQRIFQARQRAIGFIESERVVREIVEEMSKLQEEKDILTAEIKAIRRKTKSEILSRQSRVSEIESRVDDHKSDLDGLLSSNFCNIREAQDISGQTYQGIVRRVSSGRLAAVQLAGVWYYVRSEIEELALEVIPTDF